MGWVDGIPVRVVACVVVRAVRGPPVKGGVYLWERFYNCKFFGYIDWRQRLEPRAGTGELVCEGEGVGQDEEVYDDSLYREEASTSCVFLGAVCAICASIPIRAHAQRKVSFLHLEYNANKQVHVCDNYRRSRNQWSEKRIENTRGRRGRRYLRRKEQSSQPCLPAPLLPPTPAALHVCTLLSVTFETLHVPALIIYLAPRESAPIVASALTSCLVRPPMKCRTCPGGCFHLTFNDLTWKAPL